MKLHEAIAYARECKGLTLRQLEKQTGLSNAHLSQIETGHIREPSFRNVVKICKALGLSLKRLADAMCETDSFGQTGYAALSTAISLA
jgi:transcriptional regulator with XRE-family HTH domain